MSEFLGEAGEETYLTQEERMMVRRLLKFSEEYPDELGTYIKEFLKVNPPQVTASQVRGSRGAARFLDANSSVVSVSNTTADTDLYTFTVPGKTIARNGALKIRASGRAYTSDAANQVIFRLKVGGVGLLAFTLTDVHMSGNSSSPWMIEATIVNIGAYNSQRSLLLGGHHDGGTGLNTPLTDADVSSYDTSGDITITLSCSWSSGNVNSVFTKDYAAVEVHNPIGVG